MRERVCERVYVCVDAEVGFRFRGFGNTRCFCFEESFMILVCVCFLGNIRIFDFGLVVELKDG